MSKRWVRSYDLAEVGKWTGVPLAIVRSPRFGGSRLCDTGPFRVLVELLSWAWTGGRGCTAPQEVIAWHLSISVRTVQRRLRELEEAGFIKVIRPSPADRVEARRNLPNTILFAGRLKKLCSGPRLDNRRKVYLPEMRADTTPRLIKKTSTAAVSPRSPQGDSSVMQVGDNAVTEVGDTSGAEVGDSSGGRSTRREEEMKKYKNHQTRASRASGVERGAERSDRASRSTEARSSTEGKRRSENERSSVSRRKSRLTSRKALQAPTESESKSVDAWADELGEPGVGETEFRSRAPFSESLPPEEMVWQCFWRPFAKRWPEAVRPKSLTGKERGQIRSVLLARYDLSTLWRMAHLLVLDWRGIRATFWKAGTRGSKPTFADFLSFHDYLVGELDGGVTSQQHRTSKYHQWLKSQERHEEHDGQ